MPLVYWRRQTPIEQIPRTTILRKLSENVSSPQSASTSNETLPMPRSSTLESVLPLETGLRSLSRTIRDTALNWQRSQANAPFLVHRCSLHKAKYFYQTLDWIDTYAPHLRPLFHLHATPHLWANDAARSMRTRRVIMNSFNETTLHTNATARGQIQRFEEECDRHDIPIINRSDNLLRMRKSECGQWLAKAGVRVPQAFKVLNPASFRSDKNGLEFPFLIREEMIHGGHSPSYLVRDESELRAVPLEAMSDPFASEFVATNDREGLYRKYRYFGVGKKGFSYSLQTSPIWEARSKTSITNTQSLQEEADFTSRENPHHHLFQQAMQSIGLDYVTFDYSYTHEGEPVVWELNATPGWGSLKNRQPAIVNTFHLIMSGLVLLFYKKAGMNEPDLLSQPAEKRPA